MLSRQRSPSSQRGNQFIGGGIWNANGSTLTLTGSAITNNSADNGASGGGLYNEDNSTIANSTFSGNTATYGAGIMNAPASGKTLTAGPPRR